MTTKEAAFTQLKIACIAFAEHGIVSIASVDTTFKTYCNKDKKTCRLSGKQLNENNLVRGIK